MVYKRRRETVVADNSDDDLDEEDRAALAAFNNEGFDENIEEEEKKKKLKAEVEAEEEKKRLEAERKKLEELRKKQLETEKKARDDAYSSREYDRRDANLRTVEPDRLSETIRLDPKMVGRIIGKGGATIRQLHEDSGASITIDQNVDGDMPRVMTISGTKAAVEKAKLLVQGHLAVAGNSVQAMGITTGIAALGGGELTQMTIPIPSTAIGKIVGKGGETVRGIQARTGCTRIQIDPDTNMCKISGSVEAVAGASRIITAIVMGDPAAEDYYGENSVPKSSSGPSKLPPPPPTLATATQYAMGAMPISVNGMMPLMPQLPATPLPVAPLPQLPSMASGALPSYMLQGSPQTQFAAAGSGPLGFPESATQDHSRAAVHEYQSSVLQQNVFYQAS